MKLLKENLIKRGSFSKALKAFPKLSLFLLAGCMGMAPPTGYNYPGYGQTPNNNTANLQQPSQSPAPPPSAPPRNDREYDRMKEEDSNREEVLGSSSRRRRGDRCEDERERHECKEQCRDMYRRRDDREDCEELTVSQVSALVDIHELLEDPDYDDLFDEISDEMSLKDWEVYLNVSIAGFDSLIKDYNQSDAKEVMAWLAEDSNVAEILKDEDDDYRTLKSLLQKIRAFTDSQLERPFIVGLDVDDEDYTAFEWAADANNDEALEYFMEFIFETATACRNNMKNTIGCMTVFCKIGRDFDDNANRQILLGLGDFENYIDDLIEEGRNGVIATSSDPGNNWCRAGSTHGKCATDTTTGYKGIIEDANDIEDSEVYNGDWVQALCGGL